MNPTREPTGRDVFAEIDEIAQSTASVLKQITESFDVQKECNVSFNNTINVCLKAITSLDERVSNLEERISALEDGRRLILP